LFSVSFIFAVLSGIISGFNLYFFPHYWIDTSNLQYLGELSIALGIVANPLISPIGILVVFYYLGKKYDLPKLIWEAVASVFSGLVIGFYLIYIVLYNISISIFPTISTDNILLFYLLSVFLAIESSIGMFFVIFASLAIGYFRRKERGDSVA